MGNRNEPWRKYSYYLRYCNRKHVTVTVSHISYTPRTPVVKRAIFIWPWKTVFLSAPDLFQLQIILRRSKQAARFLVKNIPNIETALFNINQSECCKVCGVKESSHSTTYVHLTLRVLNQPEAMSVHLSLFNKLIILLLLVPLRQSFHGHTKIALIVSNKCPDITN